MQHFWWVQVDNHGHPATIVPGKNQIMEDRLSSSDNIGFIRWQSFVLAWGTRLLVVVDG